jgi:hypothetical protein
VPRAGDLRPAIPFLLAASLPHFVIRALIPHAPAVLHYAPSLLLSFAAVILMRSAFQSQQIRRVLPIARSLWLVFLMAGAIYPR